MILRHSLCSSLFGAENTVACIAQSGAYIGIIIEAAIQMSNINLDIRMSLSQTLQSFRSSNDSHKLDMLAAVLLDKINSLQLVAELADYQLRNYENLLQPETYALLNRHPASKALAI